MKHLLWLISLCLLLTSCGDYFQFGEEPNDWEGVNMRITNESACIMVGDSMPLGIEFSDTSKPEAQSFGCCPIKISPNCKMTP